MMWTELEALLSNGSFVILAFVMLLVAKLTLDYLTPFKVDDQFATKDNPAFGVSLIGYYLGVLIVVMGAIQGAIDLDRSLAENLLRDAGWAALGIVLLNIARVALDRITLSGFSVRKEIIDDRNVGMGAIEFGTYVGSALVVAGAISGEQGGIETALVFFAVGQVALILLAFLYEKLTPYAFKKEIENDNVAAGVAYGGTVVAVGLLLGKGSSAPFEDWATSFSEFGYYAAAALVLVLVGRYLIDLVLLPKRTLTEEIVQDRSLSAGLLEGGVLIGFAGILAITV